MSNENPLNLKQPAGQVIAELINRGNRGRNFTASDLTFGEPKQANNTAGGDTETRNTWLPVTVNATDITTEINYGRLDLAQRAGLKGLQIPYDGQTSTANLLDAINEASGLMLTTDDILNTELSGLNADALPYSAIIRARVDRSLLVIGQVEVLIVAEDEEEEPPVEEPEPDPESTPGVITTNAFSADQEIVEDGDTVTFTLNLEIAGDTDVPGPLQWALNLSGMSMADPIDVSEGLTLLAQPGATETSIFTANNLAPGQYTVVFTAVVDVWGEQDPNDGDSVPAQIRLDTTFTAAEGDPVQSSVEIEFAG